MQEKFIDLCVDDNHSAYGNEMPQRQERFRAHLEKLNFRFRTSRLDLPSETAFNNSGATIGADQVTMIKEMDAAMGQDLDTINDLLENVAKQ